MLGSVNRGAFGASVIPYGVIHSLSGGVGSLLAVILAALVARELGIQPHSTLAAGIGLAIVATGMLKEFGVFRFKVPSTGIQVPKDWRLTLPPIVWVPAYGVLLGFTWLTRSNSAIATGALVGLPIAFGFGAITFFYGLGYGMVRTSNILMHQSQDVWSDPPRLLAASAGAVAVGSVLLGVAGS